ncbi:GDP-mannose-dependent alpha-(1-6)-phosphatidylinositol monomannoside mannosyltransferase [Nocardioides dokdonensis FR1436]|uniref:GDP-mannose-dependent alpha-(1-6)-phosphatidylinositol monomannoside mannosyltransferase n=1 Tax=Nocardioides dokdonensis FR1436 TaxID=1300347 RepID=A0A1A9GS01_9ACTN|nr:glycosyltransferase [Nocardioides dokdonensis]ANH40211.1 GDP-mannose-dependent alpha-(1-6)-phosphatidylinositol monomannoside mannosyltransferase [Nocardioides dokdonensis FR1436]
MGGLSRRRHAALHAGRPRVLHTSIPTSEGTAGVLLTYVKDQVERGWSVTVACPSEGWLGYSAREVGAEVLWFDATREPGPSVAEEVGRYARIVAEVEPDLVHLHSSKAGLVGRLAVRSEVPTIFQPHGWSFLAGNGLKSRLATRWERWAARRWTDQLICVSDGEAAMGREHGVLAPVSVVPNGVDLERFTLTDTDERREARRALGLHERAPTAVCIGRLSAQKGQHVLLDAWPAVLRELPDARLVLVGSGPDEAELRERAASLEGVQMVGPRSDVPTWLSAADVVVFPSQYEGAALAPMEAMAAGRSVIASWIEGIEESLPYECGAMVRPDRPDEFAEAILTRLGNPEAADAEGMRGWRHVLSTRDAAESARRVSQLSLSLVESRPRRRGP